MIDACSFRVHIYLFNFLPVTVCRFSKSGPKDMKINLAISALFVRSRILSFLTHILFLVYSLNIVFGYLFLDVNFSDNSDRQLFFHSANYSFYI